LSRNILHKLHCYLADDFSEDPQRIQGLMASFLNHEKNDRFRQAHEKTRGGSGYDEI
jgi:hypothetical protein